MTDTRHERWRHVKAESKFLRLEHCMKLLVYTCLRKEYQLGTLSRLLCVVLTWGCHVCLQIHSAIPAPRADLRVLSLVIMLRCERIRAGMSRIIVQMLNTHMAKIIKIGMKP